MDLQHVCTVERKQKIEGKGQSASYQALATGVACFAIPVDPKDTIQSNLTVGKDYNVYFDNGADIKERDKITVNGLTLYINGVAPMLGGDVSHLEATATTKEG